MIRLPEFAARLQAAGLMHRPLSDFCREEILTLVQFVADGLDLNQFIGDMRNVRICKGCGRPIQRREGWSDEVWMRQTHCSHACFNRPPQPACSEKQRQQILRK